MVSIYKKTNLKLNKFSFRSNLNNFPIDRCQYPSLSSPYNSEAVQLVYDLLSIEVYMTAYSKTVMTPTHKGHATTDELNYRALSLLPSVSKIFERVKQTSSFPDSFGSHFYVVTGKALLHNMRCCP